MRRRNGISMKIKRRPETRQMIENTIRIEAWKIFEMPTAIQSKIAIIPVH